MNPYEMSIRAHSWYLGQQHQLSRRLEQRNERGNNSIEMAIIVGAVLIIAVAVTVAIKAAFDKRLEGVE